MCDIVLDGLCHFYLSLLTKSTPSIYASIAYSSVYTVCMYLVMIHSYILNTICFMWNTLQIIQYTSNFGSEIDTTIADLQKIIIIIIISNPSQ